MHSKDTGSPCRMQHALEELTEQIQRARKAKESWKPLFGWFWFFLERFWLVSRFIWKYCAVVCLCINMASFFLLFLFLLSVACKNHDWDELVQISLSSNHVCAFDIITADIFVHKSVVLNDEMVILENDTNRIIAKVMGTNIIIREWTTDYRSQKKKKLVMIFTFYKIIKKKKGTYHLCFILSSWLKNDRNLSKKWRKRMMLFVGDFVK